MSISSGNKFKMKLKKINISRIRKGSNSFKSIFGDFKFHNFNLIVGQNATGKSRLIRIIEIFISMLLYKDLLKQIDSTVMAIKFEVTLEIENETYDYEIVRNKSDIEEKMLSNGEIIFIRNNEKAILFDHITNENIEFFPPKDSLVLQVRRDVKSFPYFEKIIEWCTNVRCFRFGHLHTYEPFEKRFYDFQIEKNFAANYEVLEKKYKEKIIKDLNFIGYDITGILIKKGTYDEKEFIILEKGVSIEIEQYLLSQGMYRTIALITYIYYCVQSNTLKTLIIDDISEGLDSVRSSKLGKLLFEISETYDIQIIATTNDFFIMDAISIDNWTIIKRKGEEIKLFNYENSKEQFDKFKKIGLNNSDLFNSNFLK